MLAVFLCVFLLLFLVSYIYFGIKNPDYLRSEQYSLSKMAIERGLLGDNLTGLRDVNDPTSTALVIDRRSSEDSGK
jgi:hypothetical protein